MKKMKRYSRTLLVLLLAVCFSVVIIAQAYAASEAEKQAAIDAGLAYLAGDQQADGSWVNAFGGGSYAPGTTGAALLSFVEQYSKPLGWNGPNYTTNVNNAVSYLLNNTTAVDISSGAFWGNTSNDGSNIGFKFGSGTGEESYITGLVLPSLARLVTSGLPGYAPTSVISSANLAVNGLTYQQVIQRTVDLLEWSQNGPTSGVYDGGWRYILAQPNSADNSTTQWPVMGMMFADAVPGVTVAPQTKAELQNWINYIQNPGGGSGYDGPFSFVNESKTGGLLVEMVFAGGGGNMANALSYLNANWPDGASGWDGNFAHPYAMWSIYKGLEVTIGIDDMGTPITNLHADPGDVDNPNHGWNWWEDYAEALVNTQNANGSWSGYSYWTGDLATAWNINILNATEIDGGGPSQVPEPSTLLLMGAGLAGFGLLRKRIKK